MRKLLSLLLASVFVLGACSGGDEAIARVGATEIAMSDLTGLFEDTDVLPIDEAFRSTLFRLMAVEALEAGYAADFGAVIDEAAVEEQYIELAAAMEENQLTPAQFLGVAGASMEMVRFNARVVVLRDEVTERLVDDGFVQLVIDDALAITTVCARHILTATEDEALAAREAIEGGQDFGEVATEISLDTSPAGDLGCSTASRYVPEFARATVEAPIGELTGPVQSDFGFHIIEVYDRSAPTADEIRANPRDYIPAAELDSLWAQWFNDQLQGADAEVLDPKYGSWSPVGIVPADDAEG